MLRACVLSWKGSWEDHLVLVEFAYNNSFQANIKMAPFEALYARKCVSPHCWDVVGERSLLVPNFVQQTSKKVLEILLGNGVWSLLLGITRFSGCH